MSSRRKQGSAGGNAPVTYETVREIASGLPGAVEGIFLWYAGIPGGQEPVRQTAPGRRITRREDRRPRTRAMRMRADPETFYITDHYRTIRGYWCAQGVDPDDLRDLLEDAWRLRLEAAARRPRKRPERKEPRQIAQVSRGVWIAAPSCLSSTDGRETSTSAATWVTIQP